MHVANAKEPFHDDYLGQFDVVHLRLLVGGVQQHEWDGIVRNVLDLLKPGGFLQWEEIDPLATEALRGSKEPSSVANMVRVRKTFIEHGGSRLRYGWNVLRDIFLDVGMKDVDVDIVTSDRLTETRYVATLCTMRMCTGSLRRMIKTGSLQSLDIAEFDKLEEMAYKEIEAGGFYRSKMYISFGFKT